ncbi:MAG: hypothetical protein Q8S00_18915 [Deltaproteobacteria bacterium]|nr:hypothetical protein [Deltaproteobacteria bacterium]
MYNAGRMRRPQPFGDLDGEPDGRADIEKPTFDYRTQTIARDVLHDNVKAAIVCLIEVENSNNIVMA